MTHGTIATEHVPRSTFFHHRALRRGETLHDMSLGAGESAHITGLHLLSQRLFGFARGKARIDRYGRLFIREQNPVAGLPRKLFPRDIDVDTQRDQDIAKVLAAPS